MSTMTKTFGLGLTGAALAMLTMPAIADARPHHAPRYVKVCRHSSGTAGLIGGGAAGAAIGAKVIGGGIAGPIAGAVGGAFAGRAIDRAITAKKRCHYERR
ncbi:hypothetical protein GTZ99_10805 [Novosphingobium sp. FSY-8]|uniref:17 kDa surface antigen n=1 Tax=Novosphingobium ovatum TaxID=1908523 RepID=A0ABW9XET0_9SPHN|nr:hypothetical protein [Novosphingobium ovatum]NBC37045.1 hypothetical protein [Novosphingobium ovatum]